MPARRPHFLVVEDETLLRQLLCQHLRGAYPGSKITEAATLAEAKSHAAGSFDLAIVDLELSDGNSLEWAQDWAAKDDCPRIIILSSHDEDLILYRALRSRIPGFVHKNDATEVLHAAIKTVLAEGTFFSPTVQRMRMQMQSHSDFFNKILSEKEQEVLKYLGAGMADEEVAAVLGLQALSIAVHRKHIMRKLDLHSQVELMRYAIEKGFARI